MIKRSLLIFATFIFMYGCGSVPVHKISFPDAKFSTGDDPAWKEPGFDDSKWENIKTDRAWDDQGYADYDGYAWYRITFDLPRRMLEGSYLKEVLQFRLAKIDDVDETYLNGKLIGKTGNFPEDPGEYDTRCYVDRLYTVPVTDPAVLWGKKNVLAIRVYDGNRSGGIMGGDVEMQIVDIVDKLDISYSFREQDDSNVCIIKLENRADEVQSGELTLDLVTAGGSKVNSGKKEAVSLAPADVMVTTIECPKTQRMVVDLSFKNNKTVRPARKRIVAPYILTPPAPSQPRINGARVFGVRPGSPFLFKIAASGEKPVRYLVRNLPEGLSVNPENGVITGKLEKAGEYRMTLVASNHAGTDEREFTVKAGDVIALTPPMGWNSWNCWGGSVTEAKVRSSAQAILDKGLVDYGWTYVNIDDAWQASERDRNGILHSGPHFPDMKGLSSWLHEQGLKLGIYSSPGPITCDNRIGSYGFEKQDADMYADWGIDYLKYDWCRYDNVFAEEGDFSREAHIKPYKLMEGYLREQKRDIIYSLCQYGMDKVWEWGAGVDGNCWRTTGDITDTWNSLHDIGFNQAGLYPYAGPGRWNDPDMLIIGMVGWGPNLHPTRLTVDEQYTHVTLWSLLAAPLLLGCDISQMDDFTLNLITNSEVIDINQDALGKQGQRIYYENGIQIWRKELEDGSHAVGIFNTSAEDVVHKLYIADLGIGKVSSVRDVWRQQNVAFSKGRLKVELPSHGCALYRIK